MNPYPGDGDEIARARPAGTHLAVPLVELAITQELSVTTLPALAAKLDQVLSLRPQRVVIELAGCPFIDAAAIGVLLDAHRRLWQSDGLLSLRSPNGRLRRILHAARVDHVLHLIPEVAPRPAVGAAAPARDATTGGRHR
jgi:anti-anti-sigma factor